MALDDDAAGDGLSPSAARPRWASRRYVLPILAMIAAAVALVEFAYTGAPVPPGVDPGHWLGVGGAYVGLPYPPQASAGSPFVDPPLPFPFLGAAVRLMGGPLSAGFLVGGVLVVLYGLSVLHVARRFLVAGPSQVGFAGVAIFNATTLSMLFWGGYPNFLGLILLNEAMVFFLAFVEHPGWRTSLPFFGLASLLYLTHDLTFVIFLGALLLVPIVLVVARRAEAHAFRTPSALLGLALLAATVGSYLVVTRALRIVPPGYLSANPAAFVIDNVGQTFNALTTNCKCFGDNLPPLWAFGALLGVTAGLLLGTFLLRRSRVLPRDLRSLAQADGAAPPDGRARFLNPRILLPTGWTCAALLVPALGFAAHVDTDYSRFGYFLVLPGLLTVATYLDRVLEPWLAHPASSPGAEPVNAPPTAEPAIPPGVTADGLDGPVSPADLDPPPTAAPPRARRRWRAGRALLVADLVVAVLLVLLTAFSAVPLTLHSETVFTTNAHDSTFLAATDWLNGQSGPGSVMTVSSAARWVQALTTRASYDYGPTWVLFYPWQILNAQESYFALNSRYAVTNNNASLLFTGYNTSSLGANPLYVPIVQGIEFPMFRIAPGSTVINATTANVTRRYAPGSWGNPLLTMNPTSTPTIAVHASGPIFNFSEVGTMGSGSTAWVNLTVVPNPGSTVNSLQFTLAQPQLQDPLVHAGSVVNVAPSASGFNWTTSNKLGQLPGDFNYTTSAEFVPAPTSMEVPVGVTPPTNLTVVFNNPAPSRPFAVSLRLSTPGCSNPAVRLPAAFDSLSFLRARDVHFLLLPVVGGSFLTLQYYEAEFGFRTVYSNSGWTILEG